MKVVRLVVVVVVAVMMLVSVANAQSITNTLHNFSTNAWVSGSQLCGPCHTPHNALTNSPPLWAHTLSTTNYTVYDSTTLNAAPLGQPGGESLACLSCHDGTVALEAYVGGPAGTTYISGGADLGTDLSDDHPISFDYTVVAAADNEINAEGTSTPLGNDIQTDLLFNNLMQCSSCHDPHGTANASLLKITVNGSQLCLVCHDK